MAVAYRKTTPAAPAVTVPTSDDLEDWQRAGLIQEDVEREVVGLALIDASMDESLARGHFEALATALKPADFSMPLHRQAVTQMLRIAERGLRPSLLLLDAELRGHTEYSFTDVSMLTAGLADTCSRAQYADMLRKLKDTSARRRTTLLLAKVSAATVDPDLTPIEMFERLAAATQTLREDYLAGAGGADDTIANVVSEYREMVASWRESPGALRGATTGIRALDNDTRGIHDGDLWVIGARMSMAKTALMLSMALGAARRCEQGHQVGIISLEMRKTAIVHRLASMLSGQGASDIEDGAASVDWERVEDGLTELEQLPIRVIDAHGAANRTNGSRGKMTVDEIGRHARAWHQTARLDALYVDYLELVSPRKDDAKLSRDLQVGGNAIALKALASELDIPLVLLCQLNRETEKRASHVPTLSDLRYSDEIAAVADVVLFPVRWDYYRERGQEVPQEGRDKPEGAMDLWIAKQRNRAVGMVPAFYLKERMQVVDFNEMRGCPVDYNGAIIPRIVRQGSMDTNRGRR